MEKQDHIDNFFRKSLSEFELSNQNGNWQLLNHLLNQQARRKKRRLILIIIFLLGIITTGIYFLMPGNKINPAAPESSSSESEKPFQDKSLPATKEFIPDEVQKSPNEITGKNNNEIKTKDTKNSRGRNVEQANNKTKQEFQGKKGSHDLTEKNDARISDAQHTTGITPYQKSENTFKTAEENSAPDSNKPVLTEKEIIPAHDDSVYSDALPITSLPANDSLTKTDSIQNTSPAESQQGILNFDIIAGSVIYSPDHSSVHLAPLAGIELVYALYPKMSLGVAAIYSRQGGYNLNDSATAIQEIYFLGKEVDAYTQTIRIRQLDKLYVPVTFYYSPAKKHSILAAIQLSWVMNTTGDFSEKKTVNGVTSESEKNNVNGYMDGIKTSNVSFSLGYKYDVSKRFAVQLRFTQEVMKPYTPEYFDNVNSDPSLSAQTFLSIKF
jgi:hypothetical protein